MVAYSFQPRFELPIRSRSKACTIRATGKRRHAQPGETIQLYTGMRTKRCRLIATARCVVIQRIQILFTQNAVLFGEYPKQIMISAVDDFARKDGFSDWADMTEFWKPKRRYRGDVPPDFDGLLIKWAPESLVEAP